ncbi:MAG: HEPN domain-containing protein [Candidatus Omnitrophica bacterium]|nr:HEPN domain-containing protein [Candidatus Omnitrophota bacterium]
MKKTDERVIYWLKIAEHDYETMLGLFKLKRYADSLFYGHMVLEKN